MEICSAFPTFSELNRSLPTHVAIALEALAEIVYMKCILLLFPSLRSSLFTHIQQQTPEEDARRRSELPKAASAATLPSEAKRKSFSHYKCEDCFMMCDND